MKWSGKGWGGGMLHGKVEGALYICGLWDIGRNNTVGPNYDIKSLQMKK